MKRKSKKKLTGHKIIGFLFMICSIIFLGVVLLAEILPLKYLSILIGGIFVFNLIIDFFLFRKKIKKKPRRFFTFIALLFSVVFLALSFFIYRTLGVLDSMTQDYKVYTYYIMVRDDSLYQKLSDIANKSFGYYNDNSINTKKALDILDTKVSAKNDSYGNLETLGSDLLSSKVEAILVEDSQKTKLDNLGNSSSSPAVSGFKDKTRVLYTFKVKIPIESDGVNVTKDVFNIYISGMDEYGSVSEKSRSDVNMVVTVNPKTKQILLTNIPRDYYVQIHDTTGYKDKLTHAGIYGLDTSVATIEDLLGIDINYYFKVNFSSLVNIIDALGGVEVYSEYDFQSWDGYNFSKGYNKVDGKAALSFVRERKTFNEGDNQRGKNQQAMIEAIFRKCTSPAIIIKYNSLLNSLSDSMITDMPTKYITRLAKLQLRDNSKWTITSNSLTGVGSTEYTYTYPYQGLYVMVPDSQSVELSKQMIAKVTEGELLESSYDGDSSNVHSVTKSTVYKSSSSKTNSSKKKVETPKTTEEVKKEEAEPVEDESLENNQSDVITNPEVNTGDNSSTNTEVNPSVNTGDPSSVDNGNSSDTGSDAQTSTNG